MPFTKQAHADAQQKIAHIDLVDRQNAIDLGFAKAAADAGLSEEERDRVTEFTLNKIAEARHEQAVQIAKGK